MSSTHGAAPPPTTLHITLVHSAQGLLAYTTMAQPQRGAPCSAVESAALGMLNLARGSGLQVVYGYNPAFELLKDLSDPEGLGWQSTPEIRQRAVAVRGGQE
ncbi:hypothetical protein [Hydrogenophaga sp. R2]|uniref:hypothetical protein n=1 Tax=Hydrogenophaga sp. R2 TaxID=3132827 RepID=UPI003CE760F3